MINQRNILSIVLNFKLNRQFPGFNFVIGHFVCIVSIVLNFKLNWHFPDFNFVIGHFACKPMQIIMSIEP